jgi:nicotinamide-nucleotide adenylyltransferase
VRSGTLGRAGLVARFKPVHLGHAAVLEALVPRCDSLLIGLGSANRHDLRNPWSADESAEMIRAVIGSPAHVRLLPLPDLGDGPRWSRMVADAFGPLDVFVTANDWVRELMAACYPVVHPLTLIAPERRVPIDGVRVRRALARGEDWRALVPAAVAELISARGWDARFRAEFGLETLALEMPPAPPPGLLD